MHVLEQERRGNACTCIEDGTIEHDTCPLLGGRMKLRLDVYVCVYV